MTRMHLEANPTHVIVKLDIRNMFNEIKRAEIIRIFESQPELRDMTPYLFAVHSPASPVFYADGTRAGKPCGEGTRQGSAEARKSPFNTNSNLLIILTMNLVS